MAVGKKITDLPASGSLKDTNLVIVHDGNGTKKSTLTQLSEYIGTKFSNPNLLINPNFRINQREQTEYAYQTSGVTQYIVDRFRVVFLNVKTANDGLILNANGTNAGGGYFSQVLEDAVKGDTILSFKVSAVAGTIEFRNLNSADAGDTVTISSDGVYTIKGTDTKKVIAHITKGSSCKIEWMKLEQSIIATPFVAPNYAEELDKCLRYFQTYESLPFIPELLNVSNVTNNATTWTPIYRVFIQQMRVKPTVTYTSITNRSGAKVEGNHTITLDNKGISSLRLAQSSNLHTIFTYKLKLDAEIY